MGYFIFVCALCEVQFEDRGVNESESIPFKIFNNQNIQIGLILYCEKSSNTIYFSHFYVYNLTHALFKL
jgi:hypothetical protein